MDKIYKYSVLKFRPSYWIDERLNVGLLFVFPSVEQAVFLYPNSLQRLKDFYPEVNLSRFKKYLKAFDYKARTLSTNFHSDTLPEDEFLVPDGNSFFFSEFKIGQYKEQAEILNYYQGEYFKWYQRQSKIAPNTQLTKNFKTRLEQYPDKLIYFRKKVSIPNKIDHTEFDYVWQNGTTNLVKSLSFRLASKESIQRKSFRWYGEFSQLSELTAAQNLKIDILVDEPSRKDLYQAYEEAIQVLSSLETAHNIVESEQLTNYVETAIETVKGHAILDFP